MGGLVHVAKAACGGDFEIVSPPVQVVLSMIAWALAIWPLLAWYGRRVWTEPDQKWLLLAPAAALFLMVLARSGARNEVSWRRWLPSALFMVVYAAAVYAVLPMTLRALPAIAALLFLPGPWRNGFWPAPAVTGLFVIGIPAVAMLQFYFGYPLRVFSAILAIPVLNGAGFDVVRDGVMLVWQGQAIGVDVPCSGIRMGWTALFLALTGAGLSGLGWWRTGAATLAALGMAILANAMRVIALFGIEVLGLSGRAGLHSVIGVMLFLMLTIGIMAGIWMLKPRPA